MDTRIFPLLVCDGPFLASLDYVKGRFEKTNSRDY